MTTPGRYGPAGYEPGRYQLRRDTRHRVIAGVCAGLARRFGLSRNGLRVAFVVSCVLPGPQFLAYLLLWILMPADDRY